MWKRRLFLLLILVLAAACDDNMANQAKCKPLSDAACTRSLPDGVVARDAVVDNPALTSGRNGTQYVSGYPFPLTQDVLARGQERYQIFCRPCHGAAGYGNGIVTFYGFLHPPSLHDARIASLSTGLIFSVISGGFGQMPSYSQQISASDRWAIVAYVKALELSQNAPADSLPQSDREQLPK